MVASQGPRTLYDKIFADHTIDLQPDGTALLYIDRQICHEVTTPQAFANLRATGRGVRRPDCTLATTDHNVPTTPRKHFKNISSFIEEADSRLQCETLEENVKFFKLTYFGLADKRQGIVHVIGPEQGFTLPGTTIVCGDSHTSTHGAFGALAWGIGTSEVEHVLATQTLITQKSKNMRVRVDGQLADGVTSKDLILHVIGVIGTAGGTGCVIEFCGTAIEKLSMEARMSICNMSIEGGARAGLINPDQTTFDYLKGRPMAPQGEEWDRAVAYWKTLVSDADAKYNISVDIKGSEIVPTVTWGTSPQDVVPITGRVPDPAQATDPAKKAAIERALNYIQLKPGTPMTEVYVDKVFIGSCTNARIEDLRSAARIVQGKKIASNIKRAMVVPGSGLVRQQAAAEGLDAIFEAAGFEWREAGCSMCLGMNPDILAPGERCASTSNRNFEGRQGALSLTHLCSPAMAAAAAIAGHLVDVRELQDLKDVPKPKSIGTNETQAGEDLVPEDAINDLPQSDAEAELEAQKSLADGALPKVTPEAVGMPKFEVVEGIAAPMKIDNIDTDMLIPKQFLKTIKRTGLGTALFWSMRYNDDQPNMDFILNQKPYTDSKILVVDGVNFGCGSSREHAPWALLDFGIKVIIANSFADIFFNNCFKNGMLPIILDQDTIRTKLSPVAGKGEALAVDLPKQEIRSASGEVLATFDVEEFRKHCLVNGLDDIGLTMQKNDKITAFERMRTEHFPWLDGKGYDLQIPAAVKYVSTNFGNYAYSPGSWSAA
ncbi:aconitase family-domain-containing protein [Protomyces lactucae-debilis]|uniref:3-isopropylmalate dehydratase n=1 Tax=Protomyces lactucae-debilis TaxID=2754530 RepID=A0A1Y2EVY8_PROLT|nr:aconitase family-domain-containing protein [Protomyces lactucae-debilis]ORY75749.1 aconitase family-domain-containing protein [Protomyces lactucae-debilis]